MVVASGFLILVSYMSLLFLGCYQLSVHQNRDLAGRSLADVCVHSASQACSCSCKTPEH